MPNRPPPLNSLRAFEIAARHMSFIRAAEELSVTQSAVSQQIKILESHLGQKLFIRQNNSLILTAAGKSLLPQIVDAFQLIYQASRSVQDQEYEKIIKLSAPPTFAARWLRARLGEFKADHPEFEINLVATKRWIDFKTEDIDIAIRYGRGDYEGLTSERFMNEQIFPVCSPTLLKRSASLQSLGDLKFHTLLHTENGNGDAMTPSWAQWNREFGIEGIDSKKGPSYSPATLAIDAAIHGDGIALAKEKWVLDDLVTGKLIKPFEESLSSPYAYFLVYPVGPVSRKIAIFRKWLFSRYSSPPSEANHLDMATPWRQDLQSPSI